MHNSCYFNPQEYFCSLLGNEQKKVPFKTYNNYFGDFNIFEESFVYEEFLSEIYVPQFSFTLNPDCYINTDMFIRLAVASLASDLHIKRFNRSYGIKITVNHKQEVVTRFLHTLTVDQVCSLQGIWLAELITYCVFFVDTPREYYLVFNNIKKKVDLWNAKVSTM